MKGRNFVAPLRVLEGFEKGYEVFYMVVERNVEVSDSGVDVVAADARGELAFGKAFFDGRDFHFTVGDGVQFLIRIEYATDFITGDEGFG